MIDITVGKEDGHIVLVRCKGHSGYADSGSDIVCAAVSAVIQTALLGLIEVLSMDIPFKREDGYIEFGIPQIAESRERADDILDTMLAGLKDISQGLSEYIRLEVK